MSTTEANIYNHMLTVQNFPSKGDREMKYPKTLFYTIVLLILIICFTSLMCVTWIFKRKTEESIEVVVNCSLKGFPVEVLNLKIINRNLTAEQAENVAKEVFNFTGIVKRCSSLHCYEISNITDTDCKILYLFDLGGFQYSWRGYWEVFENPNPPSVEKALKIAYGFLGKIKKNKLVPNCPLIQIGKGKIDNETTVGSTVQISFDLLANDIVMGDIIINVGEEGVIVAALGRWREVVPKGNITILSINAALNLLPKRILEELDRELKEYNIKDYPQPKKIIVHNVTLRYFSKWLSEPQDYLLPIYIFTFEIKWEETGREYFHYPMYYMALSALDGSYIYGLSLTGIS
ncbi:MAG: hypothetical protein ACTSYM_07420 [Candidatus Baldrarchaeia archaeon]